MARSKSADEISTGKAPSASKGRERLLPGIVRNLSPARSFGSGKQPKRALDDVSVRVGQGRFVAIVGESGSGKSTLARVVLGLLAADAGSVHYGETDISRTSSSEMRRLRRQVQCILQDPSGALNPRKTVGDILGEVIRLHKVEKESSLIRLKALQALELVDLQPAENYLRRYPHQLSGGQRQRVLIARAIVLDPQIIVADEAVSALDVSVKAGIINLLNELGLNRPGFAGGCDLT